ncbi:hypothetical protein [Phyllobacterium chamaecytisi]|uniref:hypothetical protein n=1 Tax=Phyllobacterium chamaecytisi TaxID=2876082 RepID=UPI001CCFAB76|nr:hypothetical protein [Phyllobacterium sp. KW56]MBZ9605476.1 hypothetical protein [Phyllobacterium sp. KW56]
MPASLACVKAVDILGRAGTASLGLAYQGVIMSRASATPRSISVRSKTDGTSRSVDG